MSPERVVELVVHVNDEMQNIAAFMSTAVPVERRPVVGPCAGKMRQGLVETARVLPKVKALVTGNALGCYVVNYLGCDTGKWIGRMYAFSVAQYVPFKGARVRVLEQTKDRIVAEVTEAPMEDVLEGVLGSWSEKLGKVIEASPEEKAQQTTFSRYTLVRDASGTWRVADRKPNWDWNCAVHDPDWTPRDDQALRR